MDDRAALYVVNDRLDGVERVSSLAFWRAAVEAGHDVEVLDDGDIAVAAAPSLPGQAFNSGLGFAHLPNLVDRALDHFRGRSIAGWVLADDPPWPSATADTTLARYAVAPSSVAGAEAQGAAVRELARDEIGPWSDVITSSSEFPEPIAAAWRSLEARLARAAHHHRYVAEIDGRPVAAASLHTHHGLGWMRAGRSCRRFEVAACNARSSRTGPTRRRGLAATWSAPRPWRKVSPREPRDARVPAHRHAAQLPRRGNRLTDATLRRPRVRDESQRRWHERKRPTAHRRDDGHPSISAGDQGIPYWRRRASAGWRRRRRAPCPRHRGSHGTG